MKGNQSLQKTGRHHLSFQLERFRRADEGLPGSGNHADGIFRIKQKLTALIHGIVSAQVLRISAFSVIEQNNACIRKECLRPRLTKVLIIIALPWHDDGQKHRVSACIPVRCFRRIVCPPRRISMRRVGAIGNKFNWSPVNEIFGDRGIDVAFSPVHPVSSLKLYRIKMFAVLSAHYCSGF